MNKTLLRLLPALLAGLALAPAARADFIGAYAPSQWLTANSNGGNGAATADASVLTLKSSNFSGANIDDAPDGASTLSFGITLATDATLSFHWDYKTRDDSGSSYDSFGYLVNGHLTQLSLNGLFSDQSGTASLLLHKGDSFAFATTSVDSLGGSATTRISSFNAVTAVPEPESLALMLAGLPLLVWRARRRRGQPG